MLGEGRRDGTVVVVKTHNAGMLSYDKAVLIYRHPKETVLAEYNRLGTHQDHVGTLSADELLNNANMTLVNILINAWDVKNSEWILRYSKPLHIISYYDLQNDLAGTMTRMLEFLQWGVSENQIRCITEDYEGLFHRTKKTVTPEQFFSKAQLERMESIVENFRGLIIKRHAKGLPLSL